MGYDTVLVQLREYVLMHLAEDQVGDLFLGFEGPGGFTSILAPFEPPTLASGPLPPISLGKMGRSLHHFLTGEFELIPSSLVSRALLGGAPIGEELMDGPARYLWADEVREIAAGLASVTSADLQRRYDPPTLKSSLFTPGGEDNDDQELFDELNEGFQAIAAYYRIAAARGNAMLIATI